LALDYGDISDTSVKRIADNAGIDVTGYKQILDAQAYRKISRKHGDAEAELSRGQMPLTTEDFARIPEIVDKAQIIERSEMKSGQPGINFTARLEDGTTFLVQEVRSGRKALAPKTMFKWKEGSEPIDVRERLDQAMATDQTGLSKSPVPENPGIEPNSTAVPAAEENIGAEAGSRKLEELAPAYIDRQWDTTPAPQAEEITPPSQPVKTSPTGGEDLPQGADEFGLSGDDMAINDQEIERLKAEGKLSAEDQQALKDATDMTQRTDAYGKAIEAAASCLVRNP
jgi:hypothetical protein